MNLNSYLQTFPIFITSNKKALWVQTIEQQKVFSINGFSDVSIPFKRGSSGLFKVQNLTRLAIVTDAGCRWNEASIFNCSICAISFSFAPESFEGVRPFWGWGVEGWWLIVSRDFEQVNPNIVTTETFVYIGQTPVWYLCWSFPKLDLKIREIWFGALIH